MKNKFRSFDGRTGKRRKGEWRMEQDVLQGSGVVPFSIFPPSFLHSPFLLPPGDEAVSKVLWSVFVIAGLTRNPLKTSVLFSGDPASGAG
ncbi:MAG: hypothetical protein LBP83_05835 [Dysgonamonadaceae bacterium]|nr:hypothetical protein [Dysgonamonadaceae bacterium]